MKEYKVYFSETGTVYNYNKAWVNADSEEEAIQAIKENDWEKLLDMETYDTEYGDDYTVLEIESIEEIKNYED